MIWLGTNVMFVPPNKEWAKEFIGELRTALPSVPILIVSPGDTVGTRDEVDPRIVSVVKQLREVATETDTAFWDFREAMAETARSSVHEAGLAGRTYPFRSGRRHLMGDRLLCALSTSFASPSLRIRTRLQAGAAASEARTKPASHASRWPRVSTTVTDHRRPT